MPPKFRPRGWIEPTVRAKQYDQKRGNSHQRGYGAAWRKLSAAWLKAYPFCRKCLDNDIITKATLVHHIVPTDIAPDRILDETNLFECCATCHGQIHAQMSKRKGG